MREFWPEEKMDIFQMIKSDHKKVKDLFKKMKGKPKGGTRESPEDIFPEIDKELHGHMEGEEKLFYSTLEKEDDLRETILKNYEEHGIAKKMLEDMDKMSKGDEKWMAKLSVLRDVVERHMKDEEGDMFKKARKVIKRDQAQELGKRFEEEKKSILQAV
ncbi:MAG: hemerythrin domain-containing protein [wastewater metagenome]|nr:hemerythrin domain-containing protein [Candidatus Loosdrechtia aerotolerans]